MNLVDFNHETVLLKDLPIPISSNDYIGKRYATKKKEKYINEFASWQVRVGIRDRRKILKFVFGDNLTKFRKRKVIGKVRIDYTWVTNFKTKQDTMKVVDASNRIKLTEDYIAKFLTVNDCYFKEFEWDTIHSEIEESFSALIYRAKVIE